jgi:hypothetical protein
MQTFLELLRQSVIIQGILAVGFCAVVAYLAITGRPIPDILVNVTMLIVGFFFGAKSTASARDLIESMKQEE